MVVVLGTKNTKDVIPLNFFGKTLKNIVDGIVGQIARRDYQDQNYKFDPKVLENLVGIDKKVFKMICVDNDGVCFNNVHIINQENVNFVGI